ncbi:MAG: succinyldiaminopimelate transaminase [Micrococcales bacterium]|nr:succinyldiaminopimelate transaminase [Micrococcales bacterium]
MGLFADALPGFPWDSLTPHAQRARSHPDGIVDLSVGTPVDPSPPAVRAALEAASDSPGYPPTPGTPQLRQAVVDWFARRRGVSALTERGVLPTVGSKELVALLPSMLGLGPGDVVVHPCAAYPTYDIGARLAGARPVPSDDPAAVLDADDAVRMVWLNSPSNPTGQVLDVPALAAVVAAARRAQARHGHRVVVASDECYAELAWESPWVDEGVPSLLDPRVAGDDLTGLLAVYSLSKQSNLAGYRAAFTAGDERVVAGLTGLRKHAGFMVPGPVQAAMLAALADDEHVVSQRARYARRRNALRRAFEDAGYVVDESSAGLYLWVRPTGAQDSWTTVADLAALGILVAPGAFYGDDVHVRVALTASDERVAHAVARLAGA